MLKIILSYLVFFPSTILCFFPMGGHMKRGLLRTSLTMGSVLICASLLFAGIQYALHLDENVLLFPLLLIFFFAYYCSLDVHISKALAVFCSSVALVAILTNVAFCLVGFLKNVPLLRALQTAPVQFVFCVLAATLLAHPYSKYGKVIMDQTSAPRTWYTTILISAAFFVINMLLLPVEEASFSDSSLMLPILLILATLLILWCALQMLFYFIVAGISEMYKARGRIQILEMEEAQFAAQQRYVEATERTRHDFQQSIRTLSALYQQGKQEELGEYLHQYIEQLPKNEISVFCENAALNAMLNYYVHEAARDQIDFTLQVSLSKTVPVSDVDLCSMIGNILYNAISACRGTSEKKMQLSVIEENGSQLYIVAVNSFDGQVRQKDGLYLSVHRKGEGFGLPSVTATAEKYGGIAQFSHEGNNFFSNVAIPLTNALQGTQYPS